ncbi:hypothetical protein AAC387_Pa02g1759 [Persea americana]
MASADVIRSCLDSIHQISDELSDAILYLDAGCSEAFQFLGAFSLLLELGVRAVCSLENMSSLDIVVDWNSTSMDPAKKMVVITSRLLSNAHRYILRCLSAHQTILSCAIFTSLSEIAHSSLVDSPLGPDAFREYELLLVQDFEELVRKSNTKDNSLDESKGLAESRYQERSVSEDEGWLPFASSEEGVPYSEASLAEKECKEANSPNSTSAGWPKLIVSVHHFPMILCPLSPRVFVLPSEGTIAEACLSNDHEDSLSPGLPPMSTGLSSDGDDTPGATLTAHFLYHLAAKMDLKLEIFSLGDLSKTIGKMLTDMSSLYDVGRRNKRSAGLLLVDRTLDLMTPCCHGDSLVDRMLSSLTRRERTTPSPHGKGFQIQRRQTAAHILRPLVDVQIPLGRILSEEKPTIGVAQLLKNIEAFATGWNSSDSGFQVTDSNSVQSVSGLMSGSFVAIENYHGAHYLEAILDRKTKEATLLIRKWLQDTLRGEKMTVNMRIRPGFATPLELRSMAQMLASDQMSLIRNRGIIQLAAAAEITLSEPHSSRWDAFVSAERVLSLSAGDTSQSLSGQIRDLIHKSVLVGANQQSLLSFQDALILAITGYILAGENFATSGSGGPFSWEEEHSLKEAIVDAILENPTAANFQFLHGLEEELEANLKKDKSAKPNKVSSAQSKIDDFDDQWGGWDDEETNHDNEQVYSDMQLRLELRDRVDHVFKIFHKLSSLKRRNQSFREGLLTLESNFSSDAYTSRGLLYKLLTMALANYDIPGLEYHSSAVGRFLKSGLGRFGLGQAKPKLGDQSVLLVFFVGGINGREVHEAWEAVSESRRPDVELILGGTTLLTPDNMFDLLLGSSSFL